MPSPTFTARGVPDGTLRIEGTGCYAIREALRDRGYVWDPSRRVWAKHIPLPGGYLVDPEQRSAGLALAHDTMQVMAEVGGEWTREAWRVAMDDWAASLPSPYREQQLRMRDEADWLREQGYRVVLARSGRVLREGLA